jgi:outer membrane lipoprotein SlyB
MTPHRPLSALFLALAVALPLALPAAAQAQSYTTNGNANAAIASFGVEQVRRLQPGEVLSFVLNGVPGATVSLQIAGATAPVRMNEAQPGHYTGDYTIRQKDRLSAASLVTARVLKDGRTSSATLSESLVQGARAPTPMPSTQITAFSVEAPERIRPGDELALSMAGTPGGQASVAVQGVAKRIVMPEVSRGYYEATYVVRRKDRIDEVLSADARLVQGKAETSQHFERALARGADAADRHGRNDRNDRQQPVAAACAQCGSVVSVNAVDVKGDGSNAIGTIAGGLLGGVLGHQVGGGTGKDLATVVGAIGGAYAGNRVENNAAKTRVFRVTVQLEGGGSQSFDYADDPALRVGTRVRVENGALVRL